MTVEKVEISLVADEPELVSTLIPGLLEHWREIAPDDTAAARVERFRAHMNRETLPIAWVAHRGRHALGTAALRPHDLDGREDLGPWLGGVYVRPEARRRGIASQLCAIVEAQARAWGFRRLYLFTLDQQPWYARLGWRPFERVVWRGRAADIMIKDAAPPGPPDTR